jgi:hypothetical protein
MSNVKRLGQEWLIDNVKFASGQRSCCQKRRLLKLASIMADGHWHIVFLFQDKNRLTDSLSRLTTDIVFKLKYELISLPECEKTTLCPVLDQSKDPSVSQKVC